MGKNTHLTRGDPLGESRGGVSRRHSSEESRGKTERAKGGRVKEQNLRQSETRSEELTEIDGRDNCGHYPWDEAKKEGEAQEN